MLTALPIEFASIIEVEFAFRINNSEPAVRPTAEDPPFFVYLTTSPILKTLLLTLMAFELIAFVTNVRVTFACTAPFEVI
jgi:hypothetical protein